MSTTIEDVILAHIEVEQRDLFTAIPGIVTDVSNLSINEINVQPAIKDVLSTGLSYDLPILQDMPIQWPAGGGAVMTFPIAVGDSVLIIFSMTSIDEFQIGSSGSGPSTPFDSRIHNMSDGYVIPGIFRDADQPSPNTTDVEIKFADGSFRLTPDSTIQMDVVETISVTNNTGELIDLLVQTLTEISNATVNTMLGPQPLINKAAIQAIIADVDTFKET